AHPGALRRGPPQRGVARHCVAGAARRRQVADDPARAEPGSSRSAARHAGRARLRGGAAGAGGDLLRAVRAGSESDMIFTLAWKELREHQAIWLTMAVMTVLMGVGLSKVVALENPNMEAPVAALTFLGMAAAYGAVCGAMMFAGEHEGGTLTFLDIFLGKRGALWMGKFVVGVVLVVAQALTVALALRLLKQEPPD